MSQVLKLLRILHELSIKDLAKNLEISPSYISDIENNKKKPTLSIIEKYSEFFNLPVSNIMYFGEETKNANNSTQKVMLNILQNIVAKQ